MGVLLLSFGCVVVGVMKAPAPALVLVVERGVDARVRTGDGKEMGEDGEPTFAAVGWIYPSLTVLAVLPTVLVNQPKPLVSACSGSFCKSSKPGSAAPPALFGGSIGLLPKPAYFPPCEGGRSAGLDAFAAPNPAKYLSSTFALPPGPLLGLSVRPLIGVPLLLPVELSGALLKFVETLSFFSPGT